MLVEVQTHSEDDLGSNAMQSVMFEIAHALARSFKVELTSPARITSKQSRLPFR